MFEGNSVERWFRDLIRSSFAYANISGRQWDGALTLIHQPAFLAYSSAPVLNVTGNNTFVTVGFDTIVTNQGSCFASNTFTAKVKGKYDFATAVRGQQLGGATAINLRIVTTNRAYLVFYWSAAALAAGADVTAAGSVLAADMNAGDTATVSYAVNGIGADTADIFGTTTPQTYFCGALRC